MNVRQENILQKKKKRSKYIILPSIIIVAIITQAPFLITIVFSFLRWNVKLPWQGISFTGLSNFMDIFTDSEFYQVLANTLVIVVVSLLFCTVFSILLGLLLNRNFKGVNICRTMIILPYFVMDCVVGIIWKTLILSPSFGFNYYIMHFFGLSAIDFFGTYAIQTIIILIIWQWTPFFFMIIIAGLQNMSEDVIESAKIDGAHGLQMLIHIKLPLIRTHINAALVLGLVNILKVFGLVYVTTSGGPGVSSSNLPYYVYKTVFYDWSVGRSAAIAVVTVAITILVTQSFFGYINRKSEKMA
jgi:sorbitol/mannitol transport system permease protein